jgi:preprotein translocase subunit SecA
MFSFFKKDKSQDLPTRDKVWKTESGAIRGLLMMAMMRLQKQQPALILTFFEEERNKLASFMRENKISFKEISELSSGEDLSEPTIFIGVESVINSSIVTDLLSINSERMGGMVYFPSHYPLTTYEDKVLARLTAFGYTTFHFCLSFDDPTLKQFGSGNMLPLLEKLGLDDHEAIEHDMVTRSIKNARKKLDEKVRSEKRANSPAEWFALNIKT